MTLWTIAHQAPLSMEFSRQEYWSGLPFPPPGESSRPRDRTQDSCIAVRFITTEPPGKPLVIHQRAFRGLLWWPNGKESACQCNSPEFDPWVRKIPWRRKWQPTLVLLPGKSFGKKSLAGYRQWSRRVRQDLVTK